MAGTGDSARTKRKVQVQYEEFSAKYAAQFVVNRSEDGVIVGFSSGVVEAQGSDQLVLPVHSRVAMSTEGAKRLIAVLTNALGQSAGSGTPEAQLPRIDG